MAEGFNTNIHLELVHFPVYNKVGEIVASSVTTLDVHDISRICRTYALGSFFVVTPLKTQQVLVERMINHWVKGFGGEYNPTRKESLLKTTVVSSLAEALEEISGEVVETAEAIAADQLEEAEPHYVERIVERIIGNIDTEILELFAEGMAARMFAHDQL